MKCVMSFLLFIALLVSPTNAEQPTSEDWFYKGNAFAQAGKFEQSIEAFSRAIGSDPPEYGHLSYFFNRGLVYIKIGDKGRAFEDFKVAARLGDKDSQEILKSEGIPW